MLNRTLLEPHMPLGIALSGGSDSTALLVLAVEALGPANIKAVTVDHGLRPEAAEEAKAAGQVCKRLGVSHDILTLELDAGSDLQARARAARYAALSSWAQRSGIGAIALGHTKNDVSETFLMRLSRGSGVDGLARMAETFERGGIRFLRPLLEASREELRDLLKEGAIAWSDDPSNEDARFTRVQMRQAQDQLSELGLTPDRLSQTAKWMQAASDVLEQAAEAWIARHAKADHGDAIFERTALLAAPKETALRVLSRALCNISGNPYRPRLSALEAALESGSATTLHGCLAYICEGNLRITREFNAIVGDEQRWTITGPRLDRFEVAPLGETGLAQIKGWRDTALLPRRSLLASPAIWQGNSLVAAPLARPDPKWKAEAKDPLLLAK